MQRFLTALCVCLACSSWTLAQQTGPDSPASQEDVEHYFQVVHSHEMMQQMVQAMSNPMHQMIHQQFLKDRDKLPTDFEARMTKNMDDMLKDMPFDQMMQAMEPVYQKHFTKGDMDSLVAFYSTPTGQKLLHELPAITAEAMQSMLPIISKQMDKMRERLQQDMAEFLKSSKGSVQGGAQN